MKREVSVGQNKKTNWSYDEKTNKKTNDGNLIKKKCPRCKNKKMWKSRGLEAPKYVFYPDFAKAAWQAATAAERERLKPWIDHKVGCPSRYFQDQKCTCGLERVLGGE